VQSFPPRIVCNNGGEAIFVRRRRISIHYNCPGGPLSSRQKEDESDLSSSRYEPLLSSLIERYFILLGEKEEERFISVLPFSSFKK